MNFATQQSTPLTVSTILKRIFPVLLSVLLLTAVTRAEAEPYTLFSGDRVLLRISAIDNQSYVGTVDISGDIRFPFVGKHAASGKTLDELAAEIALSVAGRQIQSSQEGGTSIVILDEQDIFLDIETYRPVTVVGAVAAPGRVAFEPGLSVRAAIGSAGGSALAGQNDRSEQLANFRTRRSTLRETEAWLVGNLWRVETLLEQTSEDAPLDGAFQIAADRLNESAIEDLRELVRGTRAEFERRKEDNSARIALSEKRIAFLETASDQYLEAAEIDETRLQDVLDLSTRGFSTANAADDAREGALNSSARLLSTQADLAETERELQSLLIERAGLDDEFTRAFLDEKSRLQQDFDEVRAQLKALSREIALGALENDDESGVGMVVLLHRQTASGEVTQEVVPSTLLNPGDVVEVVLSFE